MLEGVYPGKVFVDQLENPRTALLITYIESEARSTWGFLVGDSTNANTNRALNTAIFERQVIPAVSPVVLLTCDPDDWGGQMDIVMAPYPPIWMPRWHYVCRKVHYDWGKNIPEGFTVQPMQTEMLKDKLFELPDDVRATLEKWAAAESDQFADFGFVTLDQIAEKPIIAGWATIDFVAKGQGDLGFFTQPAYRRKGLGTIAAAAALEYGLTHGISQINWTCDAENQGSIGTATKLGLERIEDYQMAMLVFDEGEHMGNLGYFAFNAKDYALSARAYEKSLELNPENPHFIYYEAAQAMAMTDNPEKAFAFLSQAFERGWKDIEHAQQCKAFANLRDLPAWQQIVK